MSSIVTASDFQEFDPVITTVLQDFGKLLWGESGTERKGLMGLLLGKRTRPAPNYQVQSDYRAYDHRDLEYYDLVWTLKPKPELPQEAEYRVELDYLAGSSQHCFEVSQWRDGSKIKSETTADAARVSLEQALKRLAGSAA